ncbi:hypothetical protein SM124_14500 [Bacillus sp. 31A1R]|uniref:Uncharacterized protein n=1 Tax=Robertmurraya mangrovi TaxID=3098077 RepID=A0ABU5J0I2_9BACI|nr:hypothetical protein [Bacillus sp. 31A1R]MDZ5472925.1 hypothetical protein [Bacillus sp. 31A1R]
MDLLLDIFHHHLLNTITYDQVLKVEKEYYDTLKTFWRESNFLTPKWWLLVTLSVLSPIVWIKFVDKSRITEITSFGMFYGIAAIILDSIGSNALVWTYPIRLTPYLYPQLYPYDVGIVIIPFMFVYQRWGNDFKEFLIATGLLSAFLAFMAETFMEALMIYKEFTWKNIYSFPIYWLLGLICWGISKQFKKLEQKKR